MKKLRCQFDISKDWVKPSLVFAYGIIDKEKFEDVLSDVFNKGLIDEFGEDLEGLGSEVENKISAILDIKNLVSNLCSIYDDAKKVMELKPSYLSNMQLKYLELLKDYNVKIDNFFNPILSKYSLPVVLSPAEKEVADEELEVKDLAILDNSMEGSLEVQQQNDLSDDNILENSIMGTDSRSIVATNDINLNTEVTSDNDITFKLFKGKVTAKDDFIKRFTTDIVSRAVISVDPKKPKVFTNNADIDRSIKQYKNDLFFEVFGEPLYIGDDEMKPMRSDYIDKMNSKIMEYNSMNDGEGLKAKDIDGMIMNRHNGNYDKFLAFCMLKNFDSLIKLYGNKMVNVKENFDGMPDILGDDSAKYYFKKDRTAMSSFSNSDFTDAMSKVSGVAKMFIESTPIISDNGIEIKNKYLRTDRVFNITTKIGKYVSRLNHFESFRKTLEDIIKKEQGIKGDYKYIDSLYLSKDEIAVVKSLYVKFFKNERALESLGDFGKAVSKNYKNLSFAEVLRHEYTSGNMPMNLVDVIGATFAKTIALKYDEVSFDFETKENRIKNLEDNISRRQSSLLSQSISASFFTANERVSGRLLSRYNIDVDLTTKVVKMKLPSGKIINHNVVDGKSYNEKGEEFDFSSIPTPNVVSLDNWIAPDIYSDYIYILSAFQNLTSQQLKGLDSALINTFKASVDKDGDNKHLSYLQSLISNAAFIHGLVKQEIPDGVKDASADLISALNKIDEIEKDEIYDKRNRIFKIQFNKFSKAALGLLANSLSIVNGDKTKSVIKNSEGNSLPVYGPVNLINDVKSLIDLVKMNRVKFDKDIPLANNLFLENPELLNGISVRTNYENMGKTKSSAKLSEGETVVVDILYGYGDNKVTSGNPCFQPTVFSDKTKHSGVEINGNVNVSFFDPVSNKHINKKYKDMDANDFKTLHYQTQHMYYKALEKSMLKTYNEVFAGHDPVAAYLHKTKVLSASGIVSYDGEKLKIGKVPKEFVGATIIKEIATIESMFKAKQSYEKKGKFNNITQASLYVMSTNEKEFLSLAKKNTRRPIVVELLYTKGSVGVEINSLLVDRIKMYSPESHVDNEAYESMMEKAKETFAEKLERGFSVDYINDMGNENGLVNAIYDDFKISKTDWINSYTKRVVPFKRENGKVVLNPFIEQYFWEHNVVSENFQNLTVGTIFGHKGAGEAKKTIAMLKRMVAHQATFHPYYNGSINGVNHITKTVYVKDPKALLYNVMGMVKDDQEITDGGSAVSMLETILKNNSLLDQAVAIHKKDIGMTIDGYYNAAGLMKHASHALSNEDIRRTRGSEYDLKKLVEKMYKGEPISVETGKMYHWNIDGIPINLDITRDFNGNFIGDISSLNPMFKDGLYYLNDKGHVIKVLRIEPSTILNKGDESVVVSTNLYTVSTQNMTTGEGDNINNVPINNLNDLWSIFGAENSVTLDDNGKFSAGGFKFSYSDASHYALAEFVNRVGFWRNEESFKKLFEQTANRLSNSGINVKTMTDLRKLTDRLSTVNHNTTFDKNVDEVNQSAIFQPLKVNHIGMINFASGQKVGAKNLNDSNILNNNEDFWASETNNLHTGVQLDYEHETDESHVTEMTQIISALIFNGDTKDIALGVYGAIGEYVKKQMENFINSTNEGTLDGSRKSWLQLADVIIKKQGSDKGSLQGMILSAVEQSLKADKELISKIEQARSAVAKGTNPKLVDELTQDLANHMKSAFNVPMSDSSLFSTAFSTLSNHFTAEMIRRKFEGGGLVISGLSGFMQLQELPVVSYGSETLVISKYVPTSGESYKFWEYNMTRTKYYKNSIAAGMTHDDVILSILRQKTPASNVLIGDTVIVENADGTSKSYTLGSYTDYLEFKEEVSPSTIVTVDKTAKRMMRPLNWTWESGGIKTNLYDQIQVKRAYLFDDFYGRISTLNSALNKKTPEGMSLFEQNNERAELIKTAGKLVKFTQKYKSYLTGLGFDDLLSFDSVEQVIAGLRPIDNVKYIKQVLKEGIRSETRNIEEGFMSVNDDIADMIVNDKESFATLFPEAAEILPQLEGLSKEDVISTLNNIGFKFKISNMVQHPMEIGLPNMNASKFGLPNDIDISEVTEKTFEDQEISRVKSRIKHYDMYLRDVNGKHLYIFVKNSRNANNLIKNNLFKEAKNETITIDNKTFLTNPITGAILYEIGNNRFGHISDNGMIHDAVIVNNIEDLNLLVNNTVQEEKKYEGLMVNYAVKDPRLIGLATKYKLSTNLSDDERVLFETVNGILKKNAVGRTGMEIAKISDLLANVNKAQFSKLIAQAKRNAKYRYASFHESIKYTVARIPGQGYQSFMAAKSVFFVRSGSNTAYVSPYNYWYTGADNDIDKVFALGSSLDKNGIYIGWSPEFNYNSPELLEISKNIPYPSGIAAEETQTGYMLDLDDLGTIKYIIGTRSFEYSPEMFKKYVSLLNKLKAHNYKVSFGLIEDIDDNSKKDVLARLSKSSTYKVSGNNAIKATLNFIAAGMFNCSLSIKNAVHSESPIEMNEPAEAKDKSDKGKEAAKATPHDPSMIATFKETNMVGRDVIGIAATGIKVYSALCVRYSQLRDGKFDNSHFLRKVKQYLPDGTTDEQYYAFIGGLNWDKAEFVINEYLNELQALSETRGINVKDWDEVRRQVVERAKLGADNSLILSALLSAATDNAKELILNCINSGANTASFYIYSIIMGEEFSSVASKMISQEAEVLIKYSSENIFKKNTIGNSIDSSLKMINEGPKVYKYLRKDEVEAIAASLIEMGYDKMERKITHNGKEKKSYSIIGTLNNVIYTKSEEELRNMLKNFKFTPDAASRHRTVYANLDDDIDYGDFDEDPENASVNVFKNTMMKFSRFLQDVMEFRKDTQFEYGYSYPDGNVYIDDSKHLNLSLISDLSDLRDRAEAIKVLGQMLGINQSIKADPESLNKYFENMELYFNKMLHIRGVEGSRNPLEDEIIVDGFDARRFGSDPKYREAAVSLFEVLKYDINIFDVIANSMHFFEMYKGAIFAEKQIKNSSKRLRIADKLVDYCRDRKFIPRMQLNGKETVYKGGIPKNIYTKFTRMASDIINVRFFEDKNVTIRLRNGDFEYNKSLEQTTVEADVKRVGLNTYAGRKTFVDWFETRVIPDLKNGMIKDSNGKYNEAPIEGLVSNEFIRSLKIMIDEDRNTGARYIKYTLPIKMTTPKTLDEKLMFDTYSESFRNLGAMTYDGQNITDLFYLYNLIVNGNNVNNDSLTRIFEANFEYVLDTSKIKSHLRYIGDIDYNEAGDNYDYLKYVTLEVLIASGFYHPITSQELSNNIKKPLPIVRMKTKDYNGVVGYAYYIYSNDGYRHISLNSDIVSKYINTIDLSNSLYNSNDPVINVKQKLDSNLISYKIKCE